MTLLVIILLAASESAPLAGILNDPALVKVVREVEDVLERNPAILALHRAYLAEENTAITGGRPNADVDAVLYEVLAQRMSTSRGLFSEDTDLPEDLNALQSAGQLNVAEMLSAAQGGGSGLPGVDPTSRMLSAISPAGRAGEAENGLPGLAPVRIDPTRRVEPTRRDDTVDAELRGYVNAHSGLRGRYDRYVAVLRRYPVIRNAAEAYWRNLEGVRRAPPEAAARVRDETGTVAPVVRRPTVPRPVPPVRPRVR